MNKKINETGKKVLWKDSKYLEILRLIIFLILFTFSIVGIFISDNILNMSISLILFFVFLFFLYRQIRRRLIYITKEGIRMGNLIYKIDDKIITKQKPTLISWNKIRFLRIQSRGYYGAFGGRSFKHLILYDTENKRYDCLLYDNQGFIQILKKLRRHELLKRAL